MKKICAFLLFIGWTLTSASAETIGEVLKSVEAETQAVLSRQTGESWGVQTAADDLQRLLAQSQRLSAAMSSNDAVEVEPLQRGLASAARRAETSSVMLSDSDQQQVAGIAEKVGRVDERLTELRLRFGSKASLVPGALNDVGMEGETDGIYTNIPDLLIDVRDAVRLASTLRSSNPPFNFGFNNTTPNNLDALQVRRVVLAGWELERQLSGNVADISQTVPAWERFEREYNRLGYPGSGFNIRQLERVMERLSAFYSGL